MNGKNPVPTTLDPTATPTRSETPINEAWRRLAASGAASRYGGRAPDGRHEVLLTQPVSGRLLATGRGDSVAQAICAALAAVRADA